AGPGRGAGADRLPAAVPAGRAVARPLPPARLPLAAQPRLRRPPGQERVSLLRLRRRRQRTGFVGGAVARAAARGGSGLVPSTAPAGALAARRRARGARLRGKTEPPGDASDARPVAGPGRPRPGARPAHWGPTATSASDRCGYRGDEGPAGYGCARAPDLAGLMRPPRGSAFDGGRSDTKGLARGCPRIEPAPNGDRCCQRDRDDLKGRGGERMIFEGAGRVACSRRAPAKGQPALTLISCLVQPQGCNRALKSAAQTRRRRSIGPESSDAGEEKSSYRDGPSIDFRGHLAVRPGLSISTAARPY